jgi:hypothetical protein
MKSHIFLALITATMLAGCVSSESRVTQDNPPILTAYNSSTLYNSEQVHSICFNEAMRPSAAPSYTPPQESPSYSVDCRPGVRSINCEARPNTGGFASGFARGFNNARASSTRPSRAESRSRYSACAASLGYKVTYR